MGTNCGVEKRLTYELKEKGAEWKIWRMFLAVAQWAGYWFKCVVWVVFGMVQLQ
jgi:hypothetical protein